MDKRLALGLNVQILNWLPIRLTTKAKKSFLEDGGIMQGCAMTVKEVKLFLEKIQNSDLPAPQRISQSQASEERHFKCGIPLRGIELFSCGNKRRFFWRSNSPINTPSFPFSSNHDFGLRKTKTLTFVCRCLCGSPQRTVPRTFSALVKEICTFFAGTVDKSEKIQRTQKVPTANPLAWWSNSLTQGGNTQ